jgi:hypothetical protein
MDIITIQEIERAHDRTGKHFFDPGAMRFFNSRKPQYGWQKGSRAFFITSEQFIPFNGLPHARMFTVRVCNLDTGDIDTVGTFQAYETRKQAEQVIKNIIERGFTLDDTDTQIPEKITASGEIAE